MSTAPASIPEIPRRCACGCDRWTTKTFAPGHEQKLLWAVFWTLFPGEKLEDVAGRIGITEADAVLRLAAANEWVAR